MLAYCAAMIWAASIASTGSVGASLVRRAKADSRWAVRSASEALGVCGRQSTMVCRRVLRVAGSRASGGPWMMISVIVCVPLALDKNAEEHNRKVWTDQGLFSL